MDACVLLLLIQAAVDLDEVNIKTTREAGKKKTRMRE